LIRSADITDAARLCDIYSYYVLQTVITCEYTVPSETEFAGRIEKTLQAYPFLVLEEDGIIHGYAYAGPFKGRAAYFRSCELSVYLDQRYQKHGYGRLLYEALESKLKDSGFLNLYACIASPIVEDEYLTRNSEEFHRHLGFETVGEFHKCIYKFGRWYNMIWMEKIIGDHL
jgi:phosphinothricin acetyltransferase